MKQTLKKITRALSSIDDVRAIMLYGSHARKEATTRSDIDLLILTTKPATTQQIQETIIKLENETGATIQPTIRTVKQLPKTDTGLLQNIFQEGRILYLKEPAEIPAATILQQKPYLIYTFQITNLDQKQKAKFNTELYGRTKGKYQYTGLLQEIGGQKLSAGCITIPVNQKQQMEKYFQKNKIKYQQTKIWK